MKKIFSYIMIFALAVTVLIANKVPTYAAPSVTVSVSKTSVNVGDSITVTVSVTAGYGAEGVLQRSSGIFGGTSDQKFSIGVLSNSESFTFTASESGSCTFSAYVTEGVDSDASDVSISGGSATVTVNSKNTTTNSNNGGGTTDNTDNGSDTDTTKKSSDASLSSLVISGGTLAPEFSSSTKDYTTTVDYSVSSLAVTAKPTSDKATVASVSGNDTLEVGENTVSIVVKAEDGTTSTYNIVVTRRAENDPENVAQQENIKTFEISGNEWKIVNEIPEDVVPDGFEHSTTIIDGLEYNSLTSTFSDIVLVYMESDSGSGIFVYDSKQDAAYEYVRINSESHFIVVLMPEVDIIPDGYTESTLSIEGKGSINVYQDDVFLDTDFYFVYAVDDSGEYGWYLYDSAHGTYIRSEILSIEEENVEALPEETTDDTSDIIAGLPNKYLAIGAAIAAVALILLISLIAVIVKSKKSSGIYDDVDGDYEDDDYETDYTKECAVEKHDEEYVKEYAGEKHDEEYAEKNHKDDCIDKTYDEKDHEDDCIEKTYDEEIYDNKKNDELNYDEDAPKDDSMVDGAKVDDDKSDSCKSDTAKADKHVVDKPDGRMADETSAEEDILSQQIKEALADLEILSKKTSDNLDENILVNTETISDSKSSDDKTSSSSNSSDEDSDIEFIDFN